MELAKEEDDSAARQAFRRVRELDPKYVPAYFQEAQLLASRGNAGEAKILLKEGIALARQTGDSHAAGEMTDFLESLCGETDNGR
jgi:hypothetical protein